MLIRHCKYSASIAYDASYDATAQSQAFSGIEINGAAFNLVSNPFLTDANAIQVFLSSLGLGTITYTFSGGFATFVSYSNPNIITKIFLIQDKNGAPISWEQAVTQNECQYLQDPAVVRGCTDPDAKNYDSTATEDNGTCEYTPTSDIEIIRCRAADNAYKQAVRVRKGDLCSYDENMNCLWWQFKGVSIYGNHTFVGDVVIEAVEAEAATTAQAVVNFGAVMNDTGFLTLTITVNGVTIWTGSGDYIGNALGTYTTFQDFVDAVVAYINATISVPDYTATNVGNVVTITSVATGSAQNGYPVLFTGDEITVTGVDIPTPGVNPTFGCYDPDRQEIWFGGFSTHVCIVFVGSISTGTVDAGVITGEVVYNKTLQRKYCGLITTQDILRIDNTNTIIPGNIPTGFLGTYYGVYNEWPAAPQFAYTSSVSAVSNAINVYDAATEAQMGYSPIILGVNDDVLEITVNPQVGVRQGFYYAALFGSTQVAIIDPLTGAVGYFPTTYDPICVQFIDDVLGAGAGVYECWITSISNIIERRTEAGVLIGNITLPANVTCRSIRKNIVNGYVYISSDGGAIDVLIIRLSDLAIVCPSFELGGGAYGLVVNTDTGEVYVGNPFEAEVVILSISETTIDFDTELAGGEDASTFTRPEVVQDESNNCTSDDDVNTMLQALNDGTVGCCD